MSFELMDIAGGINAPKDFVSAGTCCGIKNLKTLDLALIYSRQPATGAGAFTSNSFPAAPVQLTQKQLKEGQLQAIIVNSGSANACTGDDGMTNARRMGQETAEALALEPKQVGVCSTGIIGKPLPMDKISAGIKDLGRIILAGGNPYAAQAIMTTDTKPKETAVEFYLKGGSIRVGGIAKGAGMIYPRMKAARVPHATMLAFITTDAQVSQDLLSTSLALALEKSFNRITVDGDTSTNDTVLVMANGSSQIRIDPGSKEAALFQAALSEVCLRLAKMIAADGEGATKLVRFEVTGAATPKQALKVARSIANSLLLKCALFGEHPNWGRILAAIGYSQTGVHNEQVSVYLEKFILVKNGQLVANSPQQIKQALKKTNLEFRVDLAEGTCRDFYYTCDISPEYVEINKE